MQLQEIIEAWNAEADITNEWQNLDGDGKVEFAMRHFESKARAALDDLSVAVYSPDQSSISVAHAIGHVKQIFSAQRLNQWQAYGQGLKHHISSCPLD